MEQKTTSVGGLLPAINPQKIPNKHEFPGLFNWLRLLEGSNKIFTLGKIWTANAITKWLSTISVLLDVLD